MDNVFFAETDGVRMKYARFGNGKEIFAIIPGLSIKDTADSAPAIAAAFADFTEKYTVYLFDRRESVPDAYTITDMSEDTYRVMRSLGIEKADMFGASQGGMILLNIAAAHPEFVGSAVVCSTAANVRELPRALFDEWVRLAKEGKQTELAGCFADNVYSEATLTAFRDAVVRANVGNTPEQLERFAILADSMKVGSAVPDIGNIRCRTLVVGCEGDKVFGADASREIAEALDCGLYIYPDAFGHAVYDEAPDFRARMLDFLNQRRC